MFSTVTRGVQVMYTVASQNVSSRGQPTRDGTPAWRFREELTTSHRKKENVVKKFYLRQIRWEGVDCIHLAQ